MILAPLVGAALVLSVATGPNVEPNSSVSLSPQQKNAAMQPLVRTATDCIVRAVAADPRFGTEADLGDLIVDSMPACLVPVRAMSTPTTAISATVQARPSSWAPISTCCRRPSPNGPATTASSAAALQAAVTRE